MSNEILLDKSNDGVAILTLNRADALNAINRDMVRAMRRAVADVEADDSVEVLIITGAGSKAFCVGIDLKERQSLGDDEAQAYRSGELFAMYGELEQRNKPAIAVVDGHCLAGGFEVALACDMILASPASTFGLPEVKWGLIPAAGGCRKLAKIIGAVRAKEIILTAMTIDADRAEQLGLINRVVAPDDLRAQALELADQVRANVQLAVRGAKRCIDYALDLERSTAFDLDQADLCYASRDRKDGIARFANRKPGAGT